MQTIFGLIKKDLLNLSSYKTSLIILIIFCGIGIITTGSINFVPIIICTIVGMISLATFNYDESSKSLNYTLTLPLTKKEMVISKYVLAIFSTIIGGILGFLLAIILSKISLIKPDYIINIDYKELLTTTIGGMFGISLIQAIQIPSIYKWGAEKGRIQMFIIIFSLILIACIIGIFSVKLGFNFSLSKMNVFFNNYRILLLIISIIIMFIISYRFSIKIFLNNEY